jgi:hypothetical protein
MKTAIILVGNVRTWETCKDNFISVLGNDADIFVTTYNKQYAYHPYIQQSLNFYDDRSLDGGEMEKMFSNLNLRGSIIDDIDSYVDVSVKPYICNRFPRDAYLSLAQYFKLNDGIELVKKYEESNEIKYDRIIKTRFDIMYNPMENIVSDDGVYVDGSGAGVFPCDWIFITSRATALSINDFIMGEIRDMKNESSLADLPHKLFLNGIRASTKELRLAPLVKTIVRAR